MVQKRIKIPRKQFKLTSQDGVVFVEYDDGEKEYSDLIAKRRRKK